MSRPVWRRAIDRRIVSAWGRVCATFALIPSGGRWAVAIVISTHAVLSLLVFPHPVAQERVRQKVLALTANSTPSIIAAGDSRSFCHVDPLVLSNKLGLPEDASINLGLQTCDVASVAAWYREFSSRVAESPIMVVSVSAWMVGPRGHGRFENNREYHAGRNIIDAAAELGLSKAARILMTPEWTLMERVSAWRNPNEREVKQARRGFDNIPPRKWVPPGGDYSAYVAYLKQLGWFRESPDGEAVWTQLRGNLEYLLSCGVQLVILDSPDHPDLLSYLAGTPGGRVHAQFRKRLSQLCKSLAIPLLRYEASDVEPLNPGQHFYDGVHLDAEGAAILSTRIGRDLQSLLDDGNLRMPSESRASAQSSH
jgi:hypothetical protein